MTDWRIAPATEADLPAIVDLVNSAYRGESSRAGWTTEADYVVGPRTTVADLTKELAAPSQPTILLLRRGESQDILSCVLVEIITRADGGLSGYVGMLTVKPGLQNGGVGREMLAAAEAEAVRRGADRTRMTVVSIRDTLIAWYQRRGYVLTGETAPFPYDEQFGEPLRPGLIFVYLEKPAA